MNCNLMEGRGIVDVRGFVRFSGLGFVWFGFFVGCFGFLDFIRFPCYIFCVSRTKVYGEMTFFL